MPKSVSAGILYDLPHGVVARLTGAARRARARRHRALLQGAARVHRHLRDRQSQPHDRGGQHLRDRLQAGQGRLPLRRLGLPHRVQELHLQALHRRQVRRRLRLVRRPAPSSTRSSTRSRTPPSTAPSCWPSYDIARIWRGVWGIDGQYDFVHATFDDGTYVPKMPPHRLGGGIYYRDVNWFARVSLLHAFGRTSSPPSTRRRRATTCSTPSSATPPSSSGAGSLVPEITVGIRGENLLNDDIRNSVSYKKDEVLQPGANVRLLRHRKAQLTTALPWPDRPTRWASAPCDSWPCAALGRSCFAAPHNGAGTPGGQAAVAFRHTGARPVHRLKKQPWN